MSIEKINPIEQTYNFDCGSYEKQTFQRIQSRLDEILDIVTQTSEENDKFKLEMQQLNSLHENEVQSQELLERTMTETRPLRFIEDMPCKDQPFNASDTKIDKVLEISLVDKVFKFFKDIFEILGLHP